MTAEKALLFEPSSANTRKLLDIIVPQLQTSAGDRLAARQSAAVLSAQSSSEHETYRREAYRRHTDTTGRLLALSKHPPFELQVLEGVLMVTTGERLPILPPAMCMPRHQNPKIAKLLVSLTAANIMLWMLQPLAHGLQTCTHSVLNHHPPSGNINPHDHVPSCTRLQGAWMLRCYRSRGV